MAGELSLQIEPSDRISRWLSISWPGILLLVCVVNTIITPAKGGAGLKRLETPIVKGGGGGGTYRSISIFIKVDSSGARKKNLKNRQPLLSHKKTE